MSPHTRPRQDAGLSNHWTLRRIGAAVMIRRLDLDVGRADLAAHIGVPTSVVEAIEHGRYDPRLETALAWAPGTLRNTPATLEPGERSR